MKFEVYDTEQAAIKKKEEFDKQFYLPFCPLIDRRCTRCCVCFEPAKHYATISGNWRAVAPCCGNAMFDGARWEQNIR